MDKQYESYCTHRQSYIFEGEVNEEVREETKPEPEGEPDTDSDTEGSSEVEPDIGEVEVVAEVDEEPGDGVEGEVNEEVIVSWFSFTSTIGWVCN